MLKTRRGQGNFAGVAIRVARVGLREIGATLKMVVEIGGIVVILIALMVHAIPIEKNVWGSEAAQFRPASSAGVLIDISRDSVVKPLLKSFNWLLKLLYLVK